MEFFNSDILFFQILFYRWAIIMMYVVRWIFIQVPKTWNISNLEIWVAKIQGKYKVKKKKKLPGGINKYFFEKKDTTIFPKKYIPILHGVNDNLCKALLIPRYIKKNPPPNTLGSLLYVLFFSIHFKFLLSLFCFFGSHIIMKKENI